MRGKCIYVYIYMYIYTYIYIYSYLEDKKREKPVLD